jgi:hypothetical protein
MVSGGVMIAEHLLSTRCHNQTILNSRFREVDMEKRQHLIALTVSNFRRLKAFHMRPERNGIVILTGKNEQGKSSAIGSLCAAFQGERYTPKAPIHRGAERAEIIAETEDFVVTRNFTAKGTAVVIRDAEGPDGEKRQPYSSPQTLLDKFYAFAGFDLQAFARMSEKDRTAKLLEICPVDIDLAKNKADEKKAYDFRADLARDLKQAQAALKEAPLVEGAPAEEVSVGALSETLVDLQERDKARSGLITSMEGLGDHLAEWQTEIERLEEKCLTALAALKASRATLATLPDSSDDITKTQTLIAGAEEQNALYRQAEARGSAIERVTQAEKRHLKADKKVDKIRAERADALKRAEFPVETMTLADDGTVMYKDIPFSEASTKEEIEVGMMLAIHANPKLRLGFIREGSALDSDAVQMIDDTARANDFLVVMERVEDDNPAAIEIVDGCTREVPGE